MARNPVTRTFLLARHGESEWNARGIYQGWLESNLSARGRTQAEALGRHLFGRPPAAIYSSPLKRACESAGIICSVLKSAPDQLPEATPPELRNLSAPGDDGRGRQAPAEVIVKEDLREIDHGSWSGLAMAEVASRWPELLRQWQEHPSAVRMPNGESLSQLKNRLLRFVAQVRHAHAEGNILVVTHGTVIRLLLTHLLGMSSETMWRFQLDNGGISVIEDWEPPIVTAINDTGHLDGVRSDLDVQVC